MNHSFLLYRNRLAVLLGKKPAHKKKKKQHIFPCQLYCKIKFNSNWALNNLNIVAHGPALLVSDKQLSVLTGSAEFSCEQQV